MTTGTRAAPAVGCVHRSALSATHARALKAVLAITALFMVVEILAALINGTALFVIAGAIVVEAVRRMGQPPEVQPGILFGVAAAGLVANLVGMRILREGHQHSLNVRGAYLHIISDLLGSVPFWPGPSYSSRDGSWSTRSSLWSSRCSPTSGR